MIHSTDNNAIIAQCTPQGNGAIALLRLSGKNAFTIIDSLSKLPSGKKLSTHPTHTIHYGWIVDENGTHIDQVLFLFMRAPNTFTGDDTVEITCHNNPFIIEAIIALAIKSGAQNAQNGEFTKQAVLNNKIDIIQAEAINDLIHANTQQALKQSLSQLQGSFSHWIATIEKELIKALAFSESSFEFLDEENMDFHEIIKEIITNITSTINTLKKTFDQQQQIREGIRIAIIGSVNVGKSSLFNALLNKDRAIVTNIAGTTRDVIEAGLYKNGNYWTMIDTAGLRQTNDIIEHNGIQRSHEEAHKADIILLVLDGSQTMSTNEQTVYTDLYTKYQQKIIIIKNKTDLPQKENVIFDNLPKLEISSKNKCSIIDVENAIKEKITSLFQTIESPFLLNKRHYVLLIALEKKLNAIMPMLDGNVEYELVSYHLNDALATVSELTGKTISEAGMDAVFREFCVGK